MPETVIAVPVWDTESGHRLDPGQAFYTMNFLSQMHNVSGDWLCVVVDNGSDSPNTLAFLDSLDDPRFHVIRNAENMGYSIAANQGVRYGIERGAKYVIVSNADMDVSDYDWVDAAFVSYLKEHPDWVMGARLIPDNGGTCFAGRPPIPYLEGYLLAMTADLWQELGGFDENIFAYFEDVDLCYRAQQRGAVLVQSPSFEWMPMGVLQAGLQSKVAVYHHGGKTGYNREDFDYVSVTRQSRLYFQHKHGLLQELAIA